MKQKLSAYILFIRVKKKCRVGIGSLGVKEFKRGYYLYIGSGKKNLMERLKHIDYLLKNSNVSILDIYITYLSEDEIFSVLKRQRNITPFLENFGSGDTSNLTHFFSVDKKESLVSILCKIEKWK
jgi:Uri superfamily endonuclease